MKNLEIQLNHKIKSLKMIGLAVVIALSSLSSSALAAPVCPLVNCPGTVVVFPSDDCECTGETLNIGQCQLRLHEGASCVIAESDLTGSQFTIISQNGTPGVIIDNTTLTVTKMTLKNVDALILDSDIQGDVTNAGSRVGHRVRLLGTLVSD